MKGLQQYVKTLSDVTEVEECKASIREYHKLFQVIRWSEKNSSERAIGVRRIYQRSYIFDTGRKLTVNLRSVIDLVISPVVIGILPT